MRAAEYRLSQVSRIVSFVIIETSSSWTSCRCRFRPLLKAFMRRRMTFKADIWACRDAASASASALRIGGGPIILAGLPGGPAARSARGPASSWTGGVRAVRRAAAPRLPRVNGANPGSAPPRLECTRTFRGPLRGAVSAAAEGCLGRQRRRRAAGAGGLYLLASLVAPGVRLVSPGILAGA